MKRFFKILVVSLVAVSVSFLTADAQKKNKKKTEEVTFNVEIDCPNCVKKLEASLPFEKGVKNFKLDFDKQTIYFKYQPSKTTQDALKKAIEENGSKVKGVKKDAKS